MDLIGLAVLFVPLTDVDPSEDPEELDLGEAGGEEH
jgi:hypothetical protein